MALSLAALVPSFAVLGFTQYQVDRSRHAEIQDLAVSTAKLASFELDRIVQSIEVVLVATSHVPDVRNMTWPGCTFYLDSLRSGLPNLAGLVVLDADGRFRCGFQPPTASDETFIGRPYFLKALATEGAVIGEYTANRAPGRPVLPIAMAIRDGEEPKGVLVASLDLSWLGEQLKERGVPAGGSITVADRGGVIIAREPLPERFVGTRIPDAFTRLLVAPHAGWEEVMSQDGTRRVLGYVPLSVPPEGLYVSAGLSSEASYEAVNIAARMGAILAMSGALATLLATWVIGNRMFVRPIQEVTRVLRAWRAGDGGVRTRYDADSGELGELGAELDKLMDEIVRSQEQRALLAGELEHRVKNTLATVQALALSTMNRQAPGKDVLPDFLARIAALARTHDVLTRERWDHADLRDLLVGVLAPLVGDVEGRVRLHGPRVQLSPHEALGMTMVVHELGTNALKYGSLGSPGGRVELTWVAGPTAAGRALDVTWREKDGPPVIPPDGKTGFGTRLIDRALSGFGRTAVEFDPSGLICRIEILTTEAALRPVEEMSPAVG